MRELLTDEEHPLVPADCGAFSADGRQELFLLGGDGQLYTSSQTQANGGFSGWSPLGGSWQAGDAIGVGRNADGRLQARVQKARVVSHSGINLVIEQLTTLLLKSN